MSDKQGINECTIYIMCHPYPLVVRACAPPTGGYDASVPVKFYSVQATTSRSFYNGRTDRASLQRVTRQFGLFVSF